MSCHWAVSNVGHQHGFSFLLSQPVNWSGQSHVVLISGGDRIRRKDWNFRSQRDPRDQLIQTFNRWAAEAVP